MRGFYFSAVLLFVLLGCANQNVSRAPAQTTAHPFGALRLCQMRVSNAPPSANGIISRSSRTVCVKGINLLLAPATNACLSSGFGTRRGRTHKGLDYQAKPAGPVIAAASGIVVENTFRKKDMGHWIVIDHGNSIYTGYGHLASVSPNIKIGKRVKQSTQLGIMGRSGRATSAIHLHYEVRHGNYHNRSGWWGLTPINLFTMPNSCH